MKARSDKSRILNYSMFTESIKEFSGPVLSGIDLTDSTTGKKIGLRILNKTVKQLYEMASFFDRRSSGAELLLKTKDSVNHDYNINDRDVKDHTYCYESYFKGKFDMEKSYRTLRSDLDRNFNLKSAVEKISTKCLVLSIQDSVKFIKLETKFNSPVDDKGFAILDYSYYLPSTGKGFVIKGYPLGNGITSTLRKIYGNKYQIVNGIHVDSPFTHFGIDLKLSCQFDDLPSLQKELLKHGISLREETRLMNFLVIRDAE